MRICVKLAKVKESSVKVEGDSPVGAVSVAKLLASVPPGVTALGSDPRRWETLQGDTTSATGGSGASGVVVKNVTLK